VKHAFKKRGEYSVELGVNVFNESTHKTERFKIVKKILVKDNT